MLMMWPFGGEGPNRNQLMLKMLGLLAGKAQTEPADAHDAGPFGGEGPNKNQLMLMMLGLLAGQAQKETS